MPATDVKRKVKIVTEQHVNHNKAPVEGLPMRDWSIEVFLVSDKGDNIPATIFDKVTYELHPSFGKRARQVKKEPPYRIEESGWGEFEMGITFTPAGSSNDKKADVAIGHDLNFVENRYEVVHDMVFKNPKQEFLRALDEAGLGVENGVKKGADAKKRTKKDKNVDMEKLADGLQKMTEEDLLQVVQMIHDMKSTDTYVKNDVDNGEFHVDLYTLPDPLVKQLWDFTVSKIEL